MNEIQNKNKKLIERYPFLQPRNVYTDEIPNDYDYSYILGIDELPCGWKNLFLQMCEDIRKPLMDANYLDKLRLIQVKEKFNEMRCYTNSAPKEVEDIISNYGYVSRFVCQICGKPAEIETIDYWITSYCKRCHEKLYKGKKYKDKYVPIKFDPIRKLTQFSKDFGRRDININVSDIWDRLYNKKGC